MKFLLNVSGDNAINIDVVRHFSVEQMENERGENVVCIVAELSYKDDEILKEFNSGDAKQDLQAAKDYLANLVEILNGGNS